MWNRRNVLRLQSVREEFEWRREIGVPTGIRIDLAATVRCASCRVGPLRRPLDAVEFAQVTVPITLADAEIAALIAEKKVLPANFLEKAHLKRKRSHSEAEVTVTGANGSEFKLLFRRNAINQLDFSAILAVRLPRAGRVFRLRRYNGLSHIHTNRIERQTIMYAFHIHYATERYQAIGMDEESYAEATSRYHDFDSAVECLIGDCSCEFYRDPATPQLPF